MREYIVCGTIASVYGFLLSLVLGFIVRAVEPSFDFGCIIAAAIGTGTAFFLVGGFLGGEYDD